MSLIKFEYGSVASSSDVNNNFNYLEDLIETLKTTITDKTAGFSSTVVSLNQNVEQLLTYRTSFIQTGMIIPSLVSDIPTGFLLCDGSEVRVDDFEELYNVIGKLYTSSDSTLFKLPDLRGKTLWGMSANLTPGQELSAQLPNIKGQFRAEDQGTGNASGALYSKSRKHGVHSGDGGAYGNWYYFNASRSSAIYTDGCETVQPPAVVVNYLIKY